MVSEPPRAVLNCWHGNEAADIMDIPPAGLLQFKHKIAITSSRVTQRYYSPVLPASLTLIYIWAALHLREECNSLCH